MNYVTTAIENISEDQNIYLLTTAKGKKKNTFEGRRKQPVSARET